MEVKFGLDSLAILGKSRDISPYLEKQWEGESGFNPVAVAIAWAEAGAERKNNLFLSRCWFGVGIAALVAFLLGILHEQPSYWIAGINLAVFFVAVVLYIEFGFNRGVFPSDSAILSAESFCCYVDAFAGWAHFVPSFVLKWDEKSLKEMASRVLSGTSWRILQLENDNRDYLMYLSQHSELELTLKEQYQTLRALRAVDGGYRQYFEQARELKVQESA